VIKVLLLACNVIPFASHSLAPSLKQHHVTRYEPV
jgi:hypothetical protein